MVKNDGKAAVKRMLAEDVKGVGNAGDLIDEKMAKAY